MADSDDIQIPEDLLRRTAEAKAKALGVPVEDVLAALKGEGPPVDIPPPDPEPDPVEEVPAGEEEPAEVEVEADMSQDVAPEAPKVAETADDESAGAPPPDTPDAVSVGAADGEAAAEEAAQADAPQEAAASVATAVEDRPAETGGNGSGNGRVASMVSPRPVVPPTGLPEGVRTQRLLTVVKARAIQNVKAEPADKVNTWPHLMLMEFGALLGITALLVIMAVIIHSPLLDPANINATPNPSKAPWYFLGLQELLSYFDPQVAGVMIPGFAGLVGLMMVPYIDKNPSTRPSDRKFAIALYSVFLAGSAALTIIGVLFRGRGFLFTYPWRDGVFFDDILDWVHFE